MARASGDWVPIRGWGQDAATVIPGPPADFVLVSPRDEDPVGPGEVGVVEVQNEVVVERVVGQVQFFPSDDTLIIERIRVGLLDNAGLAAFYTDDFSLGPDANEPFSWQRVSQGIGGTTNMDSPIGHPYWSTIDSRVSRKLTRDQALFYSVQVFGVGVGVRVGLYLRSWARIVNRS